MTKTRRGPRQYPVSTPCRRKRLVAKWQGGDDDRHVRTWQPGGGVCAGLCARSRLGNPAGPARKGASPIGPAQPDDGRRAAQQSLLDRGAGLEPRRFRLDYPFVPVDASDVGSHCDRTAPSVGGPRIDSLWVMPEVHSAALAMLRLKQFDKIAGRVDEQNLGSARSGHDVVSEFHTGGAQSSDLSRKIIDNQGNSMPAPWLGALAVRHSSSRRTGGAAQQ